MLSDEEIREFYDGKRPPRSTEESLDGAIEHTGRGPRIEITEVRNCTAENPLGLKPSEIRDIRGRHDPVIEAFLKGGLGAHIWTFGEANRNSSYVTTLGRSVVKHDLDSERYWTLGDHGEWKEISKAEAVRRGIV